MLTTDPLTWHDLGTHPRFANGLFDPAWYEGDSGADLARLRACALEVLSALPGAVCELVVLDDCTAYVHLRAGVREADVYPVESGFYVGFPNLDELHVAGVAGVIAALRG